MSNNFRERDLCTIFRVTTDKWERGERVAGWYRAGGDSFELNGAETGLTPDVSEVEAAMLGYHQGPEFE